MTEDGAPRALLLSVDEVHHREARDLAPYAAHACDSEGRDHPAEPDRYRSAFQRDRDRIVHSRAFRRLAYKTQVFINDEGDLYRSRLTHTMELVQLARSAARRLRLNEDLVECVAMAHDLGHPPFGHRGEDMIDELMAEHGGFDHHHQALRIVEELEQRYPDYPGLNLTYEVRDCLAKLGCVTERGRVPRRYRREYGPLLEAQLVDEVDSIAYDCHDLDDGLRSGILRLDDLNELELWRGAWQQACDNAPRDCSDKILTDRAIHILLDAFITDLVEHSARLIGAAAPADLTAVRAADSALIAPSGSMRRAREELEQWMFRKLYRDWRVNRTFHKARRLLAELFAWFCAHPDTLTDEHQARTEAIGCERAVADYLAGMTDRFAQDEHARLLR
ncbi:MAG: deoxyguanosinetriphosphate triphosphohydrolase [Planctomycetota bacterium]|jgi:dGTPase|nr:deoxyguanosinetriphosphate triphosphohydrolase [Planctomycetota bacterium]